VAFLERHASMTRLNGVILVCAATGLAAAVAAAGCSSSSSNPAGPIEAGVAAGVEASAADAGETTLLLQWKVVSFSPADGGVADNADGGADDDAASDGGASDSTASEAGVSEAGVSEAGVGEAGVSEAGGEDAGAGVADAAVDAGEGTDEAGADAGNLINLANAPPLPGVQVCVYQNTTLPCVTTAADGTFMMMGLPVRSDLVLSFAKSGYSSILQPIETASTDMDGRGNPIIMNRPDPTFLPPGLTADPTKGDISAFAVTAGGDGGSFTGVGGTTITLSPMSGSGPYFVNQQGTIDPSAKSFESSQAYYFNVDPGTYVLTYANSGYDCEPISFPFGLFGFPVTSPAHSLKLIVAAGYTTGIVGALCTVNPVIVAVDGG
jgi:hypothetical protein